MHTRPAGKALLEMCPARSLSTDPRKRVPLTPARLITLRRLEDELKSRVLDTLEHEARYAALIARAGSDLSSLRFEGEAPRFTHVGIALREQSTWFVDHVLNTHEGPEGHLYRPPLIDFFRDDPHEYAVGLLIPSLRLQIRLQDALHSKLRAALYTPRYSRVAYPFAPVYQNSNQWAAELIGAAQGGGQDRERIQRFLAQQGLVPSALLGIGPLRQVFARLGSRNTRFDDHPPQNRRRGRLEFLLACSLRSYLKATDELRADRVVCLRESPSLAAVSIASPCGTLAQATTTPARPRIPGT